MIFKKSTKELMNILSLNENGFKSLKKRGMLSKRLDQCGYTLISEEKKGRKIIYTLSGLESQEGDDTEKARAFTKDKFNIRNDKFPYYYFNAVENCKSCDPKSAYIRARELNMNRSTLRNWDEKLCKQNVMYVDKNYEYSYILFNVEYNLRIILSQEEYSTLYGLIEVCNWRSKLESENDLVKRGKIDKRIDLYDRWEMMIKEENLLCKVINDCLRLRGIDDTDKYIYIDRGSKDERKGINKLQSYHITKTKKYFLNENSDIHKEAVSLYSKVVK